MYQLAGLKPKVNWPKGGQWWVGPPNLSSIHSTFSYKKCVTWQIRGKEMAGIQWSMTKGQGRPIKLMIWPNKFELSPVSDVSANAWKSQANHRSGHSRNSEEHDEKSIRLTEAHNEVAHHELNLMSSLSAMCRNYPINHRPVNGRNSVEHDQKSGQRRPVMSWPTKFDLNHFFPWIDGVNVVFGAIHIVISLIYQSWYNQRQ